jgi:hypothetical protein
MREHLMPAATSALTPRNLILRVSDMNGRVVAELTNGGAKSRRNGRWSLDGVAGTAGLLTFSFYDGRTGSFIPADEVPNAGEYILMLMEEPRAQRWGDVALRQPRPGAPEHGIVSNGTGGPNLPARTRARSTTRTDDG